MSQSLRRVAVAVAIAIAMSVAACNSKQDGDGGALAEAENAFVACAEARGAGIEELSITAEGVSLLLYTQDTPERLYDEVAQECEREIMPMLAGQGEGEGGDVPELPDVPPGVTSPTEYVAKLREAGFDGAVLVGDDNGPDLTAGLGLANRGTREQNSAATVFDLGSVAKIFTAAATLRAAEQGHLTLETTLAEVLDKVPQDKAAITIRHLLTHRSGLAEYHDTEGDFEPMTRDEAVTRILDQDLRFAAGSDRAYSNSGYTLLAAVLEQVTGEPFTELAAELFARAGMTSTAVYGGDRLRGLPVAVGYEGLTRGENNPADWDAPSWALMGAGGVTSSVLDLHRWLDAVHDGQVLSEESSDVLYEELLTSTPQMLPGHRIVGYAGGNDFGFEVSVIELLDTGDHVVVATNSNAPDEMRSTRAALVLAQVLPES